jgi:imidazole glycerol-phosphate synthase subunit HisH
MTGKVAILDYGIGNLSSVARAFEVVGAGAGLITTQAQLRDADRLVVPGVGAYGRCATVLEQRGLLEPIREFAQSGRPFLGICVGMQLMLDYSTEFGRHAGFGLIEGNVDNIPNVGADGAPHKIPHIGWSRIQPVAGGGEWSAGLLRGVEVGSYVYFVHSYTAYPAKTADRLADSDYDGCQIAAAVANGNCYGVQFHPEKSGEVGLQIIKNFSAL